ncbi:regulator of chromosome condensation (RCC1) [Thraustotheca clavata]|uniref:Regulator of chromosome condensation (RCC1) n=1 Tax=Thraustotheca clavata TaxID=74557 RepID=A0A1W0A931_9STRA|nr:regulator of chromosome condensation (RCC1) [Thraustotheca clavata]
MTESKCDAIVPRLDTIWAATIAKEYELVEALLRDGVNVNERNSLGETPLHLAAGRGYDEIIDLLLRYGADPHVHDWESGYTPLHRSLLQGHINASLLLLNGGSSLTLEENLACVDDDGYSPMDLLSVKLQSQYPSNPRLGGEVYTFGKVDFQLGYHLPHGDEQFIPRRVKFPADTDIIALSAARYHTLVISSKGECFSWGFGKGGRLGTGTEFNCIHPVQLSFAHRVVSKVAAGENHSLALTSDGQLFSWGSNSYGQLGFPLKQTSAASRLIPKRIDALKGMTFVDIAASSVHSAAIATSGHVYTWGSNKKGQLGRKEGFGSDQGYPTPKRVDALLPSQAHSAVLGDYTSVVATKVAVSCFHTCVVLSAQKETSLYPQRQVWQWGYNAHFPSQVLLRHTSKEERLRQHHQNIWIPRCHQHNISIIDISCAQQHSIGLSSKGNVYTWGHGPSCHATNINYVPLPHRAVSVSAAKEHCAVVLSSGDVYTWGCGSMGHEGRIWQPVPKRVPRLKRATAVVAGPQHTAVLVVPSRPLWQAEDGVVSLRELCQASLARQLSLSNIVNTHNHAEDIYETKLHDYCREFVSRNLDAVLDMAKNVEDFPIYLDEALESEVVQVPLPTPVHVQPTQRPSKVANLLDNLSPTDIEKRLRALAKRMRQIADLEKLTSWTESQKEKMSRKHFILEEIETLTQYLDKMKSESPPTTQDEPTNPLPSVAEPPTPPIVTTVQTSEPSQVPEEQVESKSKHRSPLQKMTPKKDKPTKALKKTKPKFVPLESFMAAQPAPNPKPSVANVIWNPPPPSPQLPPQLQRVSVSPAPPTYSLENFIKTKGRKKPKQSPMWSPLPAPMHVPSLKEIQSSQVVEVTQSWNLKENSWGLCQENNVKLEDVQTQALIEKLLAEDEAEHQQQLAADEAAARALQTTLQNKSSRKAKAKYIKAPRTLAA